MTSNLKIHINLLIKMQAISAIGFMYGIERIKTFSIILMLPSRTQASLCVIVAWLFAIDLLATEARFLSL
jgi:hypothetical protein